MQISHRVNIQQVIIKTGRTYQHHPLFVIGTPRFVFPQLDIKDKTVGKHGLWICRIGFLVKALGTINRLQHFIPCGQTCLHFHRKIWTLGEIQVQLASLYRERHVFSSQFQPRDRCSLHFPFPLTYIGFPQDEIRSRIHIAECQRNIGIPFYILITQYPKIPSQRETYGIFSRIQRFPIIGNRLTQPDIVIRQVFCMHTHLDCQAPNIIRHINRHQFSGTRI